VKVRLEGLPEDVAQVIRTLQDAHAVVKQATPQRLTGAGGQTVVYQYITVGVDPGVEPAAPRSDRR
jgi:hypothetical protein